MQSRPQEPLFKTITSDDWKRSFAAARSQPNNVSLQIRAKLAQHIARADAAATSLAEASAPIVARPAP